jgi:hypothetical protein
MAFPVSDNFNRANSSDLGTNWTVPTGAVACNITINKASTSGTLAFEYWNADTPGNNQYAECKSPNSSKYAGPAVRVSTSEKTAYYYDIGSKQIFKNIAGTETSILTVTDATPSATVLYKLTAINSLLSVYKDGTLLGSVTDTSISSGMVGIFVFGSSSAVDDWAADEIGAQIVTADNSTQTNTVNSGSITQTQIVTASNSAQTNSSYSGAIFQTNVVTAGNSSQVNSSTSGAIVQVLLGEILADNSIQVNESTFGAITQTQDATAANSTQVNGSTSGAITMAHVLDANNSMQVNLSAIGAIGQSQITAATNSTQVNQSSSGRMVLTPGYWYGQSFLPDAWVDEPNGSTTWTPSPPTTSIWS